MAKKIQAYIDAPIKDHHDLHTGGIAYVVYAPYVDNEVRCVTLVDHQGVKHERVFTEGEMRAMLSEMEEDIHEERYLQQFRKIARSHGIVLDPA